MVEAKGRKKGKHLMNEIEQNILTQLYDNMNDKLSEESEDVDLTVQVNDAYGCCSGNSFFNERKTENVTLHLNQAYGVVVTSIPRL